LEVRLKEDLALDHCVLLVQVKHIFLFMSFAKIYQNLAFAEIIFVPAADSGKEKSLEVVRREAEQSAEHKTFG